MITATDRSNYAVLATDYETFSIVYDCIDMEDGRSTEAFYLLSQSPTLPASVERTVNNLIDQYFDRNLALTVFQSIERY